jgi:tetratricopeptide (TPR) repeat protein
MHWVISSVVAALLTLCAAEGSAAANDGDDCRAFALLRPDAAIAACSRVLARNPKDAVAYSARGSAHMAKSANGQSGEFDLAIADFSQLILLKPRDPWGYNTRANVYMRKSEYDRALADYNTAIMLNPDDAGAYYWRGRAYIAKRDYDRAIADFDRALTINPGYPDAGRLRKAAQIVRDAPPDSKAAADGDAAPPK